jgi:hypothetical protein
MVVGNVPPELLVSRPTFTSLPRPFVPSLNTPLAPAPRPGTSTATSSVSVSGEAYRHCPSLRMQSLGMRTAAVNASTKGVWPVPFPHTSFWHTF